MVDAVSSQGKPRRSGGIVRNISDAIGLLGGKWALSLSTRVDRCGENRKEVVWVDAESQGVDEPCGPSGMRGLKPW